MIYTESNSRRQRYIKTRFQFVWKKFKKKRNRWINRCLWSKLSKCSAFLHTYVFLSILTKIDTVNNHNFIYCSVMHKSKHKTHVKKKSKHKLKTKGNNQNSQTYFF